MKKEMIYTLIAVTVILIACEVKPKSEEMYDSITTTIFSNVYDESGRLEEVNIHQQNKTNLDGKYIVTETECMLQQYTYFDNDSCKIIEISDQFPQDIYKHFGCKIM